MSPAAAAFVALTAHCLGCSVCRPNVDEPSAERSACPDAEDLYRAWARAWRAERPARSW